MNQSAYDAVMRRADGRCECCARVTHLQFDHFGGRAKWPEDEASCWALCVRCHHSKTNNLPSAHYWLSHFIAHCICHGYVDARERAEKKRAYIAAKRLPHLKETP